MLDGSKIKPHLEVISSDGQRVGTVVLAERRTGATLGDAKLTTDMLDAGTATRRAQ